MGTFLRQLSLQRRERDDDLPVIESEILERAGQSSSRRDSYDSSFAAFNNRNAQIRDLYTKLLLKHSLARATAHPDVAAKGAAVLFTGNSDPADIENCVLTAPKPDLVEAFFDNIGTLNLVAPPSGNAAHFIARTAALQYIHLLEDELLLGNTDIVGPSNRYRDPIDVALNVSALETVAGWVEGERVNKKETDLITVGLSSTFSVLLELNDKDSDLCVKALQSLLNVLQHLPPESFAHTSREMVHQMHSSLRQLRQKGNEQVSEYANACMLSLSIACGTPELLFSTISTLLTDHKDTVAFNEIDCTLNLLPKNFQRLALTVQRTIQRGPAAIAMNPNLQNWWLRPLTEHMQIAEFELVYPGCLSPSENFGSNDMNTAQGCICSDGPFVYLLTIYGLFKMGTGLGETRAGKVMAHNDMMKYSPGSSLIYCNESLYLRRGHSTRLWVIDRMTLREIGEIMLSATLTEGLLFADGRQFFHAVLDSQWNFVSTSLDDSFSPSSNKSQRISCRLMDIGYTAIGDFNHKQLTLLHTITSSLKNSAVDLQMGNDVGFLLTRNGKIYYSGHGDTFGLTYSPDLWLEVPLEEAIVSFTLDSHANCLIMRSGSGSLYAIGTLSNMFEANPHKSTKKVRKIRIPNRRRCVSISGCGGAMAFASDNGQCFLHGRHIVNAHSDTIHANFGMDNVSVASVGLGKTHLVVISKTGLVYTCGLNNLNQCGRTESPQSELRSHLETSQPLTSNNVNSLSHSQYCPPNAHTFVKDVATICLKCGCCSAQGKNCPYGGKLISPNVQGTPIRAPIPRGSPCVCGVGESACLRCGICRPCGRQKPIKPETPSTEDTKTSNPSTSDGEDTLDDLPLERPKTSRFSVNNSEAMTIPGRVILMKKSNDIKVASVSVGNYHTVLLCADHQVYTFGCNNNGQLGTGDTSRQTHPYKVPLPLNVQIVQAVAGANHCVLRTMNGEVITFGAYRAGQLGRECDNLEDRFWFAKPGFVPEFGPQTGKTTSWISAKGDRTLIQSHQRLFSRNQLDECQVTANKGCLALIPNSGVEEESFCVMIPTKGVIDRFFQFKMNVNQSLSWCFNPMYDILWSFDAERVCIQGFTDGPSLQLQNVEKEPPFFCEERKLLQCTELCIPTDTNAKFSDEQLGVFLVSAVYGLSLSALAAIPQVTILQSTDLSTTHDDISKNIGNANFLPPDPSSCNVVNRFLALGGGWGYSVHCLEAIQFKANRDINLYGFGLYGGHGENTAKVKLYRNMSNSDKDDANVELISETNEILYDCPIKETAFVGFRKPILVNADVWYVAWIQIQGPSSDCGAEGQQIVRTDSEVEFTFRNSSYSNNGTDVEGGQIPEVYYKVYRTSDCQQSYRQPSASYPSPNVEPDVSIFESVALSAHTVFSVTPDTMRYLFRILKWGIAGSFQSRDYEKMQDDVAAQKQERAAFVTIVCLRIIRIYLGVVFPQYRADCDTLQAKSVASSEAVYEFKGLLDELFRTAEEKLFVEDRIAGLVVEEAVDMYVSCSYLLTPSPELLSVRIEKMISDGANNWSLLSTLKAFCKLEDFVLPILGIDRQEGTVNELLQNLVDHYSQKEGRIFQRVDPDKVISFLFQLAFASVDIRNGDLLEERLKIVAQNLLVIITKRLVNIQLNVKPNVSIYQTPRRFRQTVCQPNWETGNDAPDSIAFKVDTAGIQLQGVGMYPTSTKHQRKVTYEIEVLESKGETDRDGWISLGRCNGVAHDDSCGDGAECVLIRLNKAIPLKPNVTYAIKAVIDAGKTFFGESGISVVKLQRHGRMTFLPSSFSKNGTTVTRGQLPFFLYSIDTNTDSNFNKRSNNITEEASRLFLLIMRLLASKLSIQLSSAVKDSFPSAKMASKIVTYAAVYMEANPHKAYHVIAAFDQILPLISAANADFNDDKGSLSLSFSQVKPESDDPTKSKQKRFVQAVVESAHPYKANDFTTHFVSFDPSTEFVCVRFHEACQTAHSGDSLWVYGVAGDRPTSALYTVGRYCLNKEWPEGVIVIPGNNVWFVFETGPEREDNHNTKYGFRCTVEGLSSPKANGSTTLFNLETEFTWLCSKGCNIMVQSTNSPSIKQSVNQDCFEVIQKHGVLLQKGLNLDHVPTVAELTRDTFPSLRKSDNIQFLADFISASPNSLGGLLATVLIVEPYIDIGMSKIEIDPLVGFITNQPIRLRVLPVNQYGEQCFKNDMSVQVTVKKGVTESSPAKTNDKVSKKIFRSLTVFNNMFQVAAKTNDTKDGYYDKLRQLQIDEHFKPTVINNNRFMSTGCNPKLADYSFEELRWAYELGSTTTEILKIECSSSGVYEIQWTPLSSGRYHVEASIDGFDLESRVDFNIKVPTIDMAEPCHNVPPTPRHRPKQVDPVNLVCKATCPAVNGYAGVRIRSHPTLNAQQIGAIPRGATISYVETLRNMDGLWLRISDDVKALYCERKSSHQAWCLQYNTHLKSEHLTLHQFNGNTESCTATSTRSTGKVSWNKPQSSESTPQHQEDNPLRPLTIECFRAAFAAFVWHERLVEQLIDCANKVAEFEENPKELFRKMQLPNFELPPNLVSARNLWSTISATLNKVVRQHLIVPSPTVLRRPYQRQRINTADRLATDASNDNAAPVEELCELCGENFPKPVTAHMRVKHPGCHGPCLGHGYNSVGNYTTGWTGMCGEGGKGNAVWYLLCPDCRSAIMANKKGEVEEESDRRWREFRQINATQLISPEAVIRRNSIFLLGLCPTGQKELEKAERNKKTEKAKWIIDLYPCGDLDQIIDNDKDEPMTESSLTTSHRPRQLSQTSDPGISHQNDLVASSRVPTSISVSGNVFRKPISNYLSTIDALPEEDEDEANIAGPSNLVPKLPTLNEVVTNFSNSVPSPYTITTHPVLSFIVENHDLSAIAHKFEDSIRRAVILSHAFKVWNWLLKLVTSESSVMDIVWQYLNTMFSFSPAYQHSIDVKFATKLHLLPHPWRLCFLAGDLVTQRMVEAMHSFLATLYVILNADNVDIRLKCLCFKSWTFQLTIHEQDLLYTLCKLLCKVGEVLSDTSTDTSLLIQDDASPRNRQKSKKEQEILPIVKQFDQLNQLIKLDSSTQKQILHCLLDGSHETFWESGEEDNNRTSCLTISWAADVCMPAIIGVFIDNVQDSSYRVCQVNFTTGSANRGAGNVITLNSVNLSSKFVGWVRCSTLGTASPLKIQIKFNGRSCRLRQIVVLGQSNVCANVVVPETADTSKSLKATSPHQLSFSSAQIDAFSLFQAVAAQAFSDEFAEDENGHLRQQVIEMLFNRVQLQPLQVYVCTQIVTAVEREIVNLREKKKKNYSYVCGLMVMLVKISESRKGVEVFSMRGILPIMLSELMLFAPQIVQMQILETMEKTLRNFKPNSFDVSIFVQNMLAVIAKAITLQVKDRVARKMLTASLTINCVEIPAIWRAEKSISNEVVQLVIATLARLANNAISPAWSQVIRAELGNFIMAINKILAAAGFLPSSSSTDLPTSSFSTSESYGTKAHLFLRQPQFWIAVAAMTAIKDPSWLELSSTWKTLKERRSEEPEPPCENHDDGVTMARFFCSECEVNLCYECFSVLHLNKRKKSHTAKLVGSTLMCPKLDVHEGCTRLRVNNFLILFNCTKLSGMAEISAEVGSVVNVTSPQALQYNFGGQLSGSGSEMKSSKCRFCQNPLKSATEVKTGTCNYTECQEMLRNACTKVLPCGHWCSGINGEKECLPCFTCPNNESKQDADDLCVICFTDRLGGAPCIKLSCGHSFHYHCVKTVLEKRWHGPRILFRFMQCPLCKSNIDHPALEFLLEPLRALYEDVKSKSLLRLEYDGLLKVNAITSEESEFFNDPIGYALQRYVYVLCSKCKKAYFGGESRCQQALDSSSYKPEELICGGCSDISGAPVCGRHGTEFLEYKCRFCCSVAVYFCFGNSHFCSICHSDFQRLIATPTNLLPQCPVGPRATALENQDGCPLRVKHPPTGEEFSLGCGICRNLTTF